MTITPRHELATAVDVANHRFAPRPGKEQRDASDASADIKRLQAVIIDPRVLVRDCLANAIERHDAYIRVSRFSTTDEWIAACDGKPVADLVVYCVSGNRPETALQADNAALASIAKTIPTIVLSDSEDANQILLALENGAQGYIPTSVSIDVAVEAMHLVRVGGTYVPASSVLAWGRSAKHTPPVADQTCAGFTSRQSAVLNALRQGKANKLIAYELNMRESTVKVHVRNIMKKLKAHNRTEVAFKTNEFFKGLASD
jgi:DNA-binding NarL/FixJ family response regulator